MNHTIKKIQNILGIESARTKNITSHILWSLIFKVGSIISNLLLIPLTINYLDTENYGVWLTLSSFIAWFAFFDIGLGHGLRNKFAEAKAKNDLELALGYVSTAYYTIGSVCLVFFCSSIFISYVVDWTVIFNTSKELARQLNLLMPVVFASFSIQLVLKLISTIYTADQKPSIQGKLAFIGSVSSLLLIWILTNTTESSLLTFGIVFSILPIVVLLIVNLYAFSNQYKIYKPKRSYWKKVYFNDIFGLGASFFVIQISGIILFSTDNFIIAQLFDPREVVPYNIAYKYLSISVMLFNIILTPYWSSITEAYAKEEFEWIKKSMGYLKKFSAVMVLLIVMLVIIAPFVYKIWLGNLVTVPFVMTLSMAAYFTVFILYSPYNFFINGTGKIKLHMMTFAVGAVLNIPLSIVLVKYTSLGVEGVIIATILCVLPNLVIFPIQYIKLINRRAYGIWNM